MADLIIAGALPIDLCRVLERKGLAKRRLIMSSRIAIDLLRLLTSYWCAPVLAVSLELRIITTMRNCGEAEKISKWHLAKSP